MTKDTFIRKQKELIEYALKYAIFEMNEEVKDKLLELLREIDELEKKINKVK